MFGLMQDWPLRIHRILDYAATQFPDRDVVSRHADGSLGRTPYALLRSRALNVAQRLRHDGLEPGDRIATLAWNSASHLEIWFGAAGAGGVYHTVNPRLFPDQIRYILGHGGARTLFIEPMFLPLLDGLVDRLTQLERTVVLGDLPADCTMRLPGPISYEAWLAGAGDDRGWSDGDEREACGLCYTSGTTGEPKGVLYSHRSTVLHTLSVAGANGFSIGAGETVMPIVPMFHVNAWGLPFVATMAGARLVMPGAALDGQSLYELMEREGVTFAAGVPTIWAALLGHLRRHSLRLSSLRRLAVGGSACPRAVIETFEGEYGVEVCHAWGMTETSPVGTVASLKPDAIDREGARRFDLKETQGYAMFGVDLKILDDAGLTQPWDGATSGRLMARGWTIARQYFGDEAPILDADGFFDTGDVATIDPNGYVRIVDRTKDVIKSGGEWISSIAIESLVAAHPLVAEAAVIGVPHPKWDERPLLVIVARDGAVPSKDEVLGFLKNKIAKWWMPDDMRLVTEMPHTATGKVSKKTLRAMFADVRLDGDSGSIAGFSPT